MILLANLLGHNGLQPGLDPLFDFSNSFGRHLKSTGDFTDRPTGHQLIEHLETLGVVGRAKHRHGHSIVMKNPLLLPLFVGVAFVLAGRFRQYSTI